MKILYGGTFISKEKLEEEKIYNPIKLEYYKIKNEGESTENYGIEIVKTEYTKDKIKVERETIEKITNNEIEANKVLELMKRNEVTPITADDVLRDYKYGLLFK